MIKTITKKLETEKEIQVETEHVGINIRPMTYTTYVYIHDYSGPSERRPNTSWTFIHKTIKGVKFRIMVNEFGNIAVRMQDQYGSYAIKCPLDDYLVFIGPVD